MNQVFGQRDSASNPSIRRTNHHSIEKHHEPQLHCSESEST